MKELDFEWELQKYFRERQRRYCDRLKKVAITRSFLEQFLGPTLSQMKPEEGRALVRSILEELQQPEEVFQ